MSSDFYKNRFDMLRAGLDFAAMPGIEVGPLDNPVVTKADGDVTYIDIEDTEALRQRYEGKLDTGRIVQVDAVWGDKTLSDCVQGRKFGYAIASHVAEHVPDLITWLGEMHAVLQPGAELRLAMPDCRFSFDILRHETRLVDVLHNYLLRARRPTVRDVLDFRLHYAPEMDSMDRFEGRVSATTFGPVHSLEVAMDSARWARDLPDTYFDVHCWVFQPRSFAGVMARLAAEGLVPFACRRLVDPAPRLLEFYAFLTPCPDRAQAAASWRAAAAAALDPIAGSADSARMTPEQRIAALEAALAAMRGSTSWRITAPLRAVTERLRHYVR
jgi:hypothetical protein